jgi:mono/diheme cytochrome c family protein
MRRWVWGGSLVLCVGAALFAALLWMGWRHVPESLPAAGASVRALSVDQVTRGAYLARAGNCAACHTAQGGKPYAGGRAIETPFGRVYSSNLTSDMTTGLGRWTEEDFWQALHHGRSRDGRLLNPAFPYVEYSRVTPEDAKALWVFLKSVPPVARENTAHELAWPYRTQWALAFWRGLYFRPEVWQDLPDRSPAWNRGAYLVQGLGHCAACHTPRDRLGGYRPGAEFEGYQLPAQGWYAPSLKDLAQAGVDAAGREEWVRVLKSGIGVAAVVAGPMAEVVSRSTQYLSLEDLHAMASYLMAPSDASGRASVLEVGRVPVAAIEHAGMGAQLYERHCSSCHGERGQGVAGAYPPLAGNRAVLMVQTSNLVRTVLEGGYSPSTADNPRPHGMPPFRLVLRDDEVAAVLSYVRNAWGNSAPPIVPLDVLRDAGAVR